jgi:hypothetical protein
MIGHIVSSHLYGKSAGVRQPFDQTPSAILSLQGVSEAKSKSVDLAFKTKVVPVLFWNIFSQCVEIIIAGHPPQGQSNQRAAAAS